MPPDTPDFTHRAQLSELMDEPCSREELRACLRDLAKVNRLLFGYRPTIQWLESFHFRPGSEPIGILDIGCGYGDSLRTIENWARRRNIAVELTGLDLNPDTTAIAAEATNRKSRIRWVTADVFSYALPEPAHLVMSSLFTHHLSDGEVVRLVEWMERNTLRGWFVNDLSRAAVPYHLFGWFSKLLRLHPFVRHDGPVSIARAFVTEDWRRLCAEAGLQNDEVQIRGYTPGRLCVSRKKLL